ncbi:MAG: hypothetical protein HY455_03720 [Parcubacteria group bacterium]|nr:hypothetical protein [Parcubacteria group bacterium]
MRIVVFTSNALRHKYIANTLAKSASECLVVSECKSYDGVVPSEESALVKKHFALRLETEQKFFGEHETFHAPTLPILHKEVNTPFVYEAVKRFRPDAAFVFGSWILKEPLLSLIPSGKFINMHLGLSPYYRGSGTNFWPIVNKEPQYVGATLLHIDAGIDSGDIIAHVRPQIAPEDTVHTLGCKTIVEGGKALLAILETLESGKALQRTKQWAGGEDKFYKKIDFNEGVLKKYYEILESGILSKYLEERPSDPRLIALG